MCSLNTRNFLGKGQYSKRVMEMYKDGGGAIVEKFVTDRSDSLGILLLLDSFHIIN